jgi:transporter family-2 protein
MELLAIPFLLLVGALLSLQSGANVQLSAAAGGAIRGSALQLGLGAALLVVLSAIVGTPGAPGLFDDTEPWHLVGGLGSAIYITAGILLFPRLGAVVTVGLFITGQMLTSLALDATGWLGVSEETLGAAPAIGAVAVLVGVAMIVRAQGGTSVHPVWGAFALLAGAVLPVQGAINAQLRADLDAPITAGAWSFVVAAIVMLVVLAATPRRQASPAQLGRLPWWGWLGGLCGATYVTSVFLLIPEIGVAPTIGLTVAGQQVASIFVDAYGLLRLPRRPVTAVRLGGVAVLLAGVVLIQAG